MSFIKHHWFNLLIGLIIILCMAFSLIVVLSPKEDALNRGFIPCTQELADNVVNCQGKIWCTTKAVFQNSACDVKIIFKGVKLWIKKEQPFPWSNYIFSPKREITDQNTDLFYKENPNVMQDFTITKQQYQKLEEQNTNEEVK